MKNEQLADLSQDIQELIEELDDIKDELSDLMEAASCDDIYAGLRNIYDLVEKSYIHLNEAEEQLDDMF